MRCLSGYSLIEVVISLVVFSGIMLIFAAAMPISGKSAHVTGQYAQAVSLCQHKIDQLRAVGFGRLNYTELEDAGIIDASPSSSPYSFSLADDVSAYLPNSTASLTILSVDSRTTKVIASISWKTLATDAAPRTVTLTALITDSE